ncbi:WGR and DUF4132 domain-containing protein [uncultured Tessaracoccus sp.]|uniref:WGR and DUF4132 domain-containing protein n=1 Tax=uncultured Tessaracoccus sp. TaxID=905023 RepID=UPI00260A5846|nr:DUF4132 domain-containing protein [uncultured Tessaracoccus sp.]
MQRRLVCTEGTSDKFWYIDQVGEQVTVVYGRRGTAGTTKTKAYPSEEKALADAEKQVAAKLKKGYVDEESTVEGPLTPSENVTDTSAPKATAKRDEPKPAESVESPAAPITPTGDAHDLGLELFWWERSWDLSADPEQPQDTSPFSPEQAAARAREVCEWEEASNIYASGWALSGEPFDGYPSAECAKWWSEFFLDPNAALGANTYQEPASNRIPPEGLCLILSQASGDQPLVKCAKELKDDPKGLYDSWALDRDEAHATTVLALRAIWKLIPEAEKLELADALRGPLVNPQRQPRDSVGVRMFFARLLGGREDDIRASLDALSAGACGRPYIDTAMLPLLYATPEERLQHAKRLGVHLGYYQYEALAWVINVGPLGFSKLASDLGKIDKDAADASLRLLTSRLHGPAAVPLFLEIAKTRHAAAAEQWLESHLAQVLAADLSVQQAAGIARLLRPLPTKQLQRLVEQASGGVCQVAQEVLEESSLSAFDPSTPWWQEALGTVTMPNQLPEYLNVAGLPPIVVDDVRLGEEEARFVIEAMQADDRDQPLLAALREHALVHHRDAFAVALLDMWLANGAPWKDRWLMTGAGCVGDERFVHHLTPMIREWPGVSQHQRAVAGLGALRNVGSEGALQAIAGIAAKVKFAGIKRRAGEVMGEIAEQMGFTRDQLEDRIIPDGGLDERGTREFSFGPRRFLASVTPECKVVVRFIGEDGRPTGKPRTSLPKPNQSDDAQLAEDAKAEYTALKKTVTGLAKIQNKRFENAMISGRRWEAADFETYIAPHPLLRGLLSSVVWSIYDGESRVALGRIDEDGQLVDIDDEPVALDGRTLGIVHPVDLSEAERSSWASVQADYELVEAFPQLSRQVFTLPEDQRDELLLHGLPEGPLPAGKLIGGFKKFDWSRGEVLDAGVYVLYGKYFHAADVTAVIQFDPGMWVGGSPGEQNDQAFDCAYLLAGEQDPGVLDYGVDPRNKARLDFFSGMRHVPWSAVPRSVSSEVLATINYMVS